MTVAADVIFEDLKEPVRFVKEAKVRVFPSNEKFWNPAKPRIQEEFVLKLKEVNNSLSTKVITLPYNLVLTIFLPKAQNHTVFSLFNALAVFIYFQD